MFGAKTVILVGFLMIMMGVTAEFCNVDRILSFFPQLFGAYLVGLGVGVWHGYTKGVEVGENRHQEPS